MSTLTLKNLPATVDRLQALIRAGKSVRITDGGLTVATLEPATKKPATKRRVALGQRSQKARISNAQWLQQNPPPGPPMPDFDAGEYVRKARLTEG